MASNFILMNCDGSFGCTCPVIRREIEDKRRYRNEYMKKYNKRRRSANGAESG